MADTKIVIRIPDRLADNLIGKSVSEIESTIMDAMYEFRMNRAQGNPRAYVEKRYPGDDVYPAGPKREDKIARVQERFEIAEALHAGQITLIDPEPPEWVDDAS